MQQLLSNYELTDILLLIVCIAIAYKGVVTSYDWYKGRTDEAYEKRRSKEARISTLEGDVKNNKEDISEIRKDVSEIKNILVFLIDSDRESIRAWIVREHHYFCYQRGWIDDHSLDAIEKRYNYYKKEGGNTYIDDLMVEIRALPKVEQVK